MEKPKDLPRVRVFTRSQESCKVNKPDKALMKKWYLDTSVPNFLDLQCTKEQRNFFYDCRK
jgi:hypothetical protein